MHSEGPLEAMEEYLQRGWTDGLPIVPQAPERVSEFLKVVGLSPAETLGAIPTREVVVTAEKVANFYHMA
ncbi:MAG: hypothetical protein IIC82_07375 [Chloroflexi bacterium]|nr:hypothetical protein [Chloroflexota bacterium]